ncbi:MAG: nucleoside kinase [Bacteroidales bacterium]|nr:nucleoside kinase [Bacteroidales bacterium]
MRHQNIEIICENTGSRHLYPIGTTLGEIAEDINLDLKHSVVGALVNNKLKELTYQIYKPKKVKFIDITHDDGMRMYTRSLIFVLFRAVCELYPKSELSVRHPISNGLYCTLEKDNIFLTKLDVDKIKNRMQSLIAEDYPFERKEMLTEEAIELFEKHNLQAKTPLLKTRGYIFTSVYFLNGKVDYYYGHLVPSTGYLKVFDLQSFYNGMLLRLPDQESPNQLRPYVQQKKLLKIFSEFKRWGKILNVKNIGDLNRTVKTGQIDELIKISEALHEKKVGQIADKIRKQRKKLKLILIAGPSSSGKTTFSKRLDIQLKVNGLNPVKISLDNFFVNREDNPIDENGNYDFEALEAIDTELFNQTILDLMEGKEIEMPKFSFEKGRRYYDGEKLSVKKKDLIIVEGIHGLNPELTKKIPEENKYKIYVSALTSISIDGHNLIKTSDNRLVRRMIRDYRYRGYDAAETIARWPSVRRGEEKYIFPFQEQADIMFNSALLYELAILKKHVEPILREIQPNQEEFNTAQRLLKFFSYFRSVSDLEIPPTSIIREFLGGSSFNYD